MLESFSAELNFFDLHSLENTPDDGEDGESNNDPVGVGGADKALGDPTIVFIAACVNFASSVGISGAYGSGSVDASLAYYGRSSFCFGNGSSA